MPCDSHSYPGSYKQAASYLSHCVSSFQNEDRKHQLPHQKRLQICKQSLKVKGESRSASKVQHFVW